MIDVLLVLIIIFLVITPLAPKGLKTLVPQPSPPGQEQRPGSKGRDRCRAARELDVHNSRREVVAKSEFFLMQGLGHGREQNRPGDWLGLLHHVAQNANLQSVQVANFFRVLKTLPTHGFKEFAELQFTDAVRKRRKIPDFSRNLRLVNRSSAV